MAFLLFLPKSGGVCVCLWGAILPPCPSGSDGFGGKCTLFIGRWRRYLDLSPFRLSGLSEFSKEVSQWVKILSDFKTLFPMRRDTFYQHDSISRDHARWEQG